MSENGTETAVVPQDTKKVALGTGQVVAIIPQSFEQVYRMATIIVGSGVGPKGMTKEACAVAIMAGAEVGVPPMAAVQNIAVINGRPSMWGDLIVALVQASGRLEYMTEAWDEKTQTATVRIKRLGKPEHVESFGPTEAKRAKLADKDLYKMYPQRMHGWKAKGYAIRSQFADVLKGLSIREEVEDYIDVQGAEVVDRTPIAAPRPAVCAGDVAEAEEQHEETAGGDAGAEAPLGDNGGRSAEDEIRDILECQGKKPVEIAALLKQNAKDIEAYRDKCRAEYREKQG